jgi:putative PIN family toxin of toxin-antitoxin system
MASDARYPFVLDVNALVSAFLFPESSPGRVLDFVLERHKLLMSLAVAAELAEVLTRPKFDRYLSQQRREELLIGTISASEFIEPAIAIATCRDATENRILELSIAGRAEAVVTGDQDLLVLHPFQGIPILTPHEFLSQYAAE